jgi:hypothetical protein
MSFQLIVGQNFLECSDAWRDVFPLARNHHDNFRDMTDAVVALRTHDDLVASRLEELAPPARPAHRLSDTTVFNKAAVIIVVKGASRCLTRGVGQERGGAAWTLVLPLPLAYHLRVERVWLGSRAG